MSNSVGTAQLDLGINYKGFNNELKGIAGNAQSMLGNAFKGLGKVIAAAFATKTLFDFGKAAIGLASDLDEVQNVVDVTFGSMSEDINQWSKNALQQFGLSELSAKKFSSTMGAMLKSSGLSGQQMTKMSKDLTELTADMASFYNLDHETAFNKIRSGISGETEPLKQLGINMSVANMEAYALSKGITKSYQAMSQAEQTMLRYNYLWNATKDAQGDFYRTSDSWANQTKLLSEQWKIFQTTMGQGFINILTPVIKLLNTLIAKLQVAAQYFKAFTDMVFGTAQAAGTVAKSTEEMSSGVGDVGKSIKKTDKAVKGSLSSFDQLNTLTQGTADAMSDISDTAGGMGGMDLGAMTDVMTPDMSIDPTIFEPAKAVLTEIKQLATDVGTFLAKAFGPPLQAAINEILPVLSRWKGTLFSTFSDVAKLGEPLKAWLLNDLVPFIQQFIQYLGHIFSGLLDSALLVFKGIKKAAMPVLSWLVTDGLPLVTDFGLGVMQVFTSIFDTAKFVFDLIYEGVIQPTLMLISKITVDTLGIIKGFWDKFGADIVGGLVTAFENIKMLFSTLWTNSLGPIWTNLLNMLTWLWDKHLKGLVEEFTNFVGKLVTGALEIYNKVIVPIVKYLIEILGPSFSNAFNFIVDVLGTAIGVISDIIKGLLKSLGGIIDFIVGIFTGNWEKAWQGVKDIFGGVFDGIVGILKGAINLIIDALNFFIRAANKIKFDIPDWVPGLGGKKFGINIPQIPKLANGGLVSAPTLAMVGDNKNANIDPEVISPLSKLQEMLGSSNQAVVEVLQLILEALQSGKGDIIFKVGETEFGRAAINAINNLQRQTGKTLLEV